MLKQCLLEADSDVVYVELRCEWRGCLSVMCWINAPSWVLAGILK